MKGLFFRGFAAVMLLVSGCSDDESNPEPPDDDPPPDPTPTNESCRADTSVPGFQATEVDVVGSVRVTYSEALDPASIDSSAFTLTHLGLQEELPIDVALDADGKTVIITPQSSLAFFSDYALDASGLEATDGDACPDPELVFSTRDPGEIDRPLRPAAVNGFAVVGDVGLAASTTYRGLQIYDLTTPTSPAVVGEVLTEQSPTAIRVSPDEAFGYAPAGKRGILIFDLMDPSSPWLAGVVGTPGEAYEAVPFDKDGKRYLAIADGTGGLRVVDVTLPEGPKEVFWLHPSGQVKTNVLGVDLQGNLLAVAQQDQGFAIVDITNIGAPSVVISRPSQADSETFNVSAPVTDVAWGDGTLWVSEANHGIQAFDATTPASPVFIDHVLGPQGLCASGCPDALQGHVFADGKLFAASAMTGGVRYSVSGGAVVEEARVNVPGRVNSATVADGLLYLGTESGLAVFDSTMSSNDTPVYLEANGWGVTRAAAPSTDGAFVYVASTSRGLETYQANTPSDLVLVDLDVTPGVERDIGVVNVVVSGNRLLVGDGRAGFHLFDVSQPDNPNSMGELPGGDTVSAIAPGNGVVYACADNQGLLVIDVSGSAPVQLEKLQFNTIVGACRELELVDDYLYVAGGNGIAVLSVTAPELPALVSTLILPADDAISDLARYENHLLASTFVGDYEGTLGLAQRFLVFDITDRTAPRRVFKSPDLAASGPIWVAGDKAFVAGGPTGVLVWGLANPDEPQLEGTIEVTGSAFRVTASASGDLLYVAERGGGLGFVPVGPLP
jgi:hypothetical protein